MKLTAEGRLHQAAGESTPSFELWIENPSAQVVKVCLLRFSVIASPLVMVTLEDAKGESLLPRLPEVYPVQGEKVPFETFAIPATSRVLVRQPLMSKPAPVTAGSAARWAVWLNGEYKSGTSPLR